jgi:hypothetical protein
MNKIKTILTATILTSISMTAPAIAGSVRNEEIQEYRISETTRSIVFGKACQMSIDGHSNRYIQKVAWETVNSYEEKIQSKHARILGYFVARAAIKKCGIVAAN